MELNHGQGTNRTDEVLDTCIFGGVEKGFALHFFGVVGLA